MTELPVDHVIYAVDDLERAAEHFLTTHGLASVEGGRHPGHGTANRIIPLGPDYIELIAVVDADEAAASPLGRRVLAGEGWIGHAVRARDLAEVMDPDEPTTTMRRVRPDAIELSWTIARFEEFVDGTGPFVIEWHVPEDQLPGAVSASHRIDPIGLGPIEIEEGRIRRVFVQRADGSHIVI